MLGLHSPCPDSGILLAGGVDAAATAPLVGDGVAEPREGASAGAAASVPRWWAPAEAFASVGDTHRARFHVALSGATI